ncbi:hypothetical protein BJY16_009057 [Actinoplanes octamycinicus]|uniref:Uncharacterized protein n=1 Tax=Actinoplanes octamycinicus TaxID=135948 RepID=A0A7W7H829_9ACTN|nr:hypothetical protein [Actinoplanes octamycinicus]
MWLDRKHPENSGLMWLGRKPVRNQRSDVVGPECERPAPEGRPFRR